MSWYALAGTAISVGGGLIANNQNKPRQQPQVDPAQLGAENLETQAGLAGGQLYADTFYSPYYGQRDLNALDRSLLGGAVENRDVFGQFPELEQAYQQWAKYTATDDKGATVGREDTSRQSFLTEHLSQHPSPEILNYLSGGEARGLVDILGDVAPKLGAIQSDEQTRQRERDIGDVEALGPRSAEAFRAANPQLTQALDDLQARAGQAGEATYLEELIQRQGAAGLGGAGVSGAGLAEARLGGQAPGRQERLDRINSSGLGSSELGEGGQTGLQRELTRQAQSDLQRGGALSPAQQALVQQASRAGSVSRGMGRGLGSAVEESLNTLDYSRALQNERRGFAAGVDQLGQQQQRQNQAFALQGAGLGLAREQQGTAALGNTAQLLAGTSQDPFMSILGRPSSSAAAGQNLLGQGGMFTQSGPQIFNPFASELTGMQAANNYNASQAAIAGSNNSAALWGAGIGAAGNILGAFYP